MSSKPYKTEPSPSIDREDRVIEESEALQQVFRGERILLLPPGGLAVIGAHMSLLLGWGFLAGVTALSLTVIGDSLRAALVLLAYAAGALLASVVPGFFVVSGYASAHLRTRHLCRLLLLLALLVLAVSTIRVDQVGVVARVGAVALFLAADRLVNGPSYRLAAAYFRVRRRKALEHRRARDEILRR